MDRATLLDLLTQAEKQIVLAKHRTDEQYRIIAKLESDGHDTVAATDLLKQFVETLNECERDRDWLVSKLAVAS